MGKTLLFLGQRCQDEHRNDRLCPCFHGRRKEQYACMPPPGERTVPTVSATVVFWVPRQRDGKRLAPTGRVCR
jgi:hypothetical protein